MEQVSGNGPSAADSSLAAGTYSDPQILAMVRGGDSSAFDVLFRRHAAAAQYVARSQTDNVSDADDVVAEAFASIFQALTEGRGPDEFFRSYLLITVRRIAYDRNRKAKRTLTVGDGASLDTVATDPDTVLNAFESSTMAKAFKSLPERWQAVLWHVDIEGQKPAVAAPFIGLSPNGVSSLVIRAREGLRQAYLQNHISSVTDDSCFEYSSQLGKYARKGLKRTSSEKVEAHLEDCAKCTALLLELHDVQSGMRAVVFPLVAGTVFTPAVTAGFLSGGALSGTVLPWPAGLAGPKSGWLETLGGAWKAAVAAVVLVGLAMVGVSMWLAQTTSAPIVEADSVAKAPSASQPVLEVAPTAAEPLPGVGPGAGPTSDPQVTAVAPPPVPISAVLSPSARPTSALRVATLPVPHLALPVPSASATVPVPQGTVQATDPGIVTTTPVPQTFTTSAPPPQTVSLAYFGVLPGTGQPERQIEVAFTLQGDGTPTTGEVIFSLSPEAAFVSGKLLVPAEWTCSSVDIRQIRCTASSFDPHSLVFKLDAMLSNQAQEATLSYQLSGQNIVTKTFANSFH